MNTRSFLTKSSIPSSIVWSQSYKIRGTLPTNFDIKHPQLPQVKEFLQQRRQRQRILQQKALKRGIDWVCLFSRSVSC